MWDDGDLLQSSGQRHLLRFPPTAPEVERQHLQTPLPRIPRVCPALLHPKLHLQVIHIYTIFITPPSSVAKCLTMNYYFALPARRNEGMNKWPHLHTCLNETIWWNCINPGIVSLSAWDWCLQILRSVSLKNCLYTVIDMLSRSLSHLCLVSFFVLFCFL